LETRLHNTHNRVHARFPERSNKDLCKFQYSQIETVCDTFSIN